MAFVRLLFFALCFCSLHVFSYPLTSWDQSSNNFTELTDIESGQTIQQSFVSQFERVNFIEVNAGATQPFVSIYADLEIKNAAGEVIASNEVRLNNPNCTVDTATCFIGNGTNASVRLFFESIDLVPGQNYIFELTPSASISLVTSSSNDETSQFLINDLPQEGRNLWFRTGHKIDPYAPVIAGYKIIGAVSEIIRFSGSEFVGDVNVGDTFSGTLDLPTAGNLLQSVGNQSIYRAFDLNRAEIQINDQFVVASGAEFAIADNLNQAQDVFSTQYNAFNSFGLVAGEYSTSLQAYFSDNTTSIFNDTSLPSTLDFSQFGNRQVIFTAIHSATENSNGSLSVNEGYSVVFNIEEITPITEHSLNANFYGSVSGNQIDLYSLNFLANEGVYTWLINSIPAAVGSSSTLFAEQGVSTVSLTNANDETSVTGTQFFTVGNSNESFSHPIQVVQILDPNGDGAPDQYIYNPQQLVLGSGISATYAELSLSSLNPLYDQMYFLADLESYGAAGSEVSIWATYYTNAADLEQSDVYQNKLIGSFIPETYSLGAIRIALDVTELTYITSRLVKLTLTSTAPSDAPVVLTKVSTSAPAIYSLLGSVNTSSSSSSSSSTGLSSTSSSSSSSSGLSSSSSSSGNASSSSSTSSSSSSSGANSSTSSSSSSSTGLSSTSSSSSSSSSGLSSSSSSGSMSSSSSSSSSGGSAPLTCDYEISSTWGGGFVASVTLTNTTNAAVDDWWVRVHFAAPSNLQSYWNSSTSLATTDDFVAYYAQWNKTIYPGQSVNFGFIAERLSTEPVELNLSGSLCQ